MFAYLFSFFFFLWPIAIGNGSIRNTKKKTTDFSRRKTDGRCDKAAEKVFFFFLLSIERKRLRFLWYFPARGGDDKSAWKFYKIFIRLAVMRKRFLDFFSPQSSDEFIVPIRRIKYDGKKGNCVVAYSATHIHHLVNDILRQMEIRVTSISIFNEERAPEYLWIFRTLNRRMSCALTLHGECSDAIGCSTADMMAELHGNGTLWHAK